MCLRTSWTRIDHQAVMSKVRGSQALKGAFSTQGTHVKMQCCRRVKALNASSYACQRGGSHLSRRRAPALPLRETLSVSKESLQV